MKDATSTLKARVVRLKSDSLFCSRYWAVVKSRVSSCGAVEYEGCGAAE